MRALGNLVIVIPADPSLMEMVPVEQGFGLQRSTKIETWDLQWKIISAGSGAKFMTSHGRIVHLPLAVQVGDVVLLRINDDDCRTSWADTKFFWNGERALMVLASGDPQEFPTGNVLAVVSRDGQDVGEEIQ
jgi:hypothetical protein